MLLRVVDEAAILAAIITGTGVVADSTATVIGAMFGAPLMIPAQGTMLATLIGDRAWPGPSASSLPQR